MTPTEIAAVLGLVPSGEQRDELRAVPADEWPIGDDEWAPGGPAKPRRVRMVVPAPGPN